MSTLIHTHLSRTDDGVVTVTFDTVHRSVNVCDRTFLSELETVLTAIEQDPHATAVVFTSAKPSGFLAGADLFWLARLIESHEVNSLVDLGRAQLARMSALAVPTIAAIHGACLGGGLEFALACTHRVARNDPGTRLGLPETQLGLIPAWGGTQRLPRQIGVGPALRIILSGRPVDVEQALRLGLIDAAIPVETFDTGLHDFVQARTGMRPDDLPPPGRGQSFGDDPIRVRLAGEIRLWWTRWRLRRELRDNDARQAALTAVIAGLRHGIQHGLAVEREQFCRLLDEPAWRAHVLECIQRLPRRSTTRDT